MILRKLEQVQIIQSNRTHLEAPKKGEVIVDELADFMWRFCVEGKSGVKNQSIIATKWKGSDNYVCPGSDKTTKRTNSRRRNNSLNKDDALDLTESHEQSDTDTDVEIIDNDNEPVPTFSDVQNHLNRLVKSWNTLDLTQRYGARTVLYQQLDRLYKANYSDFRVLHDKLVKDKSFTSIIQKLIQKEQNMDANAEQYQKDDELKGFRKNIKSLKFKSASELLTYSLKRKQKIDKDKKERKRSQVNVNDDADHAANGDGVDPRRKKRKIGKPGTMTPPKHTITNTFNQIKSNQLIVKQTKKNKSKMNPRYVNDLSLTSQNGPYSDQLDTNHNNSKFCFFFYI